MADGIITVFLADDHAMVREGLASLVGKDPSLRVVGQCGDGLKVLEEVQNCIPDVVVLDISMPGLNGLDVCRELKRKVKGVLVLILTMHDDQQFISIAMKCGASGYLLKESAGAELSTALHQVVRGEPYLGPGVALAPSSGAGADDQYKKLTTRQRQVLQMIAEGRTSRQIAEHLHVAVKTIDTHRTRLMQKLDLHDRTSLVKYALRQGIVKLR